MEEPLVIVENLSKKFCKDLKTSLWYGVKDLWSGVTGNKNERLLRDKEFWAVKDISFTLRRGECLGLIGHNGAGKSTLLKILNGLINPDAGKVTIKGRVGALIELGAGFNPILTGRENIYNNGAILGFSRKEIDSKLDAIIAFAELEDFIDMPVQNYSSGMKVRLGFAVAAQMEPDVLIIDEVLAVGDLGFVLKCFKTIDTILPRTAVIFVSHNMPMVSRVATSIMMLESGKALFQGNQVSEGIDLYYQRFYTGQESNVVFDSGNIKLTNSFVEGVQPFENLYDVEWGSSIKITFEIRLIDHDKVPNISLAVYDKEQRGVAEAIIENQDLFNIDKIDDNLLRVTIQLSNLQLSKGIYYITFTASEKLENNVFYKEHKAISLRIIHNRQMWTPFLLDAKITEINTTW
ncbi:ABC transporter ATP-binding protein [Planktosalinus lacus]|uniref:ABC transporter domain-containing protein n=1 Tax=Planktosalinus lacus TaxID=1526573 RepID=A0A8J2V8K0_9FLAO|nr:ABC transporter ATP-binding protein [Planktosalinus lacus]GGD84972.1 hypothetical protein GCM10011312_06280 [Planktosalinus lacus]